MQNKLLTIIPNYGSHQYSYLRTIVEEYQNYRDISVGIMILSTESHDWTDYPNVTETVFSSDIGPRLAALPRLIAFQTLENQDTEYDLFMHQENDTLITEENIKSFVSGQSRLASNEVHGFLRYEEYEQERYLIDMHKNNTHAVGQFENDKLIVDNVHQGGWIVTIEQLQHLHKAGIGYGTTLEDSCSNFYKSGKWPGTSNGLQKYIYRDLVESSLIHHLPNKYIAADKNYLKVSELLHT